MIPLPDGPAVSARPGQRQVFSVLVENKPGALARVVGLFSARGFNIESLSVGETETRARSRVTLAVRGPPAILEQVRKQLEKLVDTVKVSVLEAEDRLERGLALLKLRVPASRRGDVLRLAGVFGARVADLRERSVILEITGTEEEIDRFASAVQDMPPAPGEALAGHVEAVVQGETRRLAQALGQVLDREVVLPARGRVPAREPAVELLEMARTGPAAMRRADRSPGRGPEP